MSEQINQEEYDSFRAFLEQAAGITLGDNKHYLVNSRLNRLMGQHDITSLGELITKLKSNAIPGLKDKIVDAMVTNETMWFRDKIPYELLSNEIFPALAKEVDSRPIRIWSSACSSGQEPYSLGMLFEEYRKANPSHFSQGLEIVATDISNTVLTQAKAGRYDAMSMARGLADEYKERYFVQDDKLWEVKPEIKKYVQFKELNLLENYTALGKFDIVLCRNVLIYFSSDLKKDIIARISKQLNPQGYLILGSSESLTGHSDDYELQRSKVCVHYRLK
jgi:chemotaxis protein methyltransferase CheR